MIVKKLQFRRNEDLDFEIQKRGNSKELLVLGRVQKNYYTFNFTAEEAEELRGFLFEEIDYKGPIREISSAPANMNDEIVFKPKKRGPKPKSIKNIEVI